VSKQIKNLLRRAMRHIQAQQMSLWSRVVAELQWCTGRNRISSWVLEQPKYRNIKYSISIKLKVNSIEFAI